MRRPAPLALALVLALVPSIASAVQPGFKVYDDQFAFVPFERLGTGIRLEEVPLSSLTTSGAASASALEALTSWNFTPAGSLPNATDSFSQAVPVTSTWTCYLPDTINCGFGAADVDVLLVSDGIKEGRATRDVSAVSYDETTGILKGRAAITDEGQAGSLAEGEARLCLGNAADAPVVPVAVFPNVEGNRRFMQFGDANWQSPVFNCFAAATLGAPCRAGGGTKATLTAVNGQTEGRIRNRFVRAGTLTLPSGHVVDSLLVESLTSYTAKDQSCFLSLLTYRQWRLAWVVPHYGLLASLTSSEDVASLTSFTTAKGAYLGYGLLPPVSIQTTTLGTNSVTVSWNPGSLGERNIDGYEVHWGPVSGKQQAPAFHSGPIPAGTTSYEITGLAPGQSIHVSVTTRKSYTDPVSNVTTLYESIKLPAFMGADSNGDGTLDTSYPPEVAVTTLQAGGCVAGDIAPDGVGNGSVSLADFVLGRRKLLGSTPQNARDTSCGDVHPGAYACQPQGQVARWCATPNALFQSGDVIAIRRKVLNALTFACSGCPQVAGGTTPHELRLPGDLTPRGATDGVVNIGDVVFALRASVGLETPDADEALRADVAPADRSSGAAEPVGNGAVDISDVVLLLRTSVSLDTLRWPIRRIRARMEDAGDFVGFRAEVAGWPEWAAPEATTRQILPCDSGEVSIVGDSWTTLCDAGGTRSGPADLFEFQYRGIVPVPPSSLNAVAGGNYVTRPNLVDEPPITVSLSAP